MEYKENIEIKDEDEREMLGLDLEDEQIENLLEPKKIKTPPPMLSQEDVLLKDMSGINMNDEEISVEIYKEKHWFHLCFPSGWKTFIDIPTTANLKSIHLTLNDYIIWKVIYNLRKVSIEINMKRYKISRRISRLLKQKEIKIIFNKDMYKSPCPYVKNETSRVGNLILHCSELC